MGDGIQVEADLTALHDRNPFNYLLFDAPLTCVCVCVCVCVWPMCVHAADCLFQMDAKFQMGLKWR